VIASNFWAFAALFHFGPPSEFPEFRTKTEFSDLAVGYSALKLELFRLRDAQANYGTVIALIDSGIDSGAMQMGKAKGSSGLSDGAHRART